MSPKVKKGAGGVSFGLLQLGEDFFEEGLSPDKEETLKVFYARHQILSEIDTEALINELFELAVTIKHGGGGESYNEGKLWFHQLCRRVQKFAPGRSSEAEASVFAPFGLLFVELLAHYDLIALAEFPITTEEDVFILFEAEWQKVKIPEGETYVSLAKVRANKDPRGFHSGMYGFFLDVAFHLQAIVGDGPFSIPTSDRTADILGISGKAISMYITKAEGQGFLRPVSKKYKPGVLARTFRFNDPKGGC